MMREGCPGRCWIHNVGAWKNPQNNHMLKSRSLLKTWQQIQWRNDKNANRKCWKLQGWGKRKSEEKKKCLQGLETSCLMEARNMQNYLALEGGHSQHLKESWLEIGCSWFECSGQSPAQVSLMRVTRKGRDKREREWKTQHSLLWQSRVWRKK